MTSLSRKFDVSPGQGFDPGWGTVLVPIVNRSQSRPAHSASANPLFTKEVFAINRTWSFVRVTSLEALLRRKGYLVDSDCTKY